MSQDIRKTAAAMAGHSISEMIAMLQDAQTYLINGNDLAAWGALNLFDDLAEDLRAAIRLHRSANRRAL